jgi:hypothetical protein
MHQFLKFISFWTNTIHVSDCLSIHHQEFELVHTARGIIIIIFINCKWVDTRWQCDTRWQWDVKQIQLPACYQAGSSICLTYACCCMYKLELLMMDGKTAINI